MAPGSSQKGTGKKGAGAIARQRSRNTTPSSVPPPASLPPIEPKQTEYLDLNYDSFRNITFEDIVDQHATGSNMPDTRNIDGIMTRLQRLSETLEKRHTNFCDRGMRLMVPILRTRMDEERSREEERLRKEAADDEERARKANKANKKKRKVADSLGPNDNNIGQSCTLCCFDRPINAIGRGCFCSSTVACCFPSTFCRAHLFPLGSFAPTSKLKLATLLLTPPHRKNIPLARFQQT